MSSTAQAHVTPSAQPAPWWLSAVIYQVYWRSFQDSTGSGTGDLRGVIERLDHIAELGVDAIWLNPFFASPGKDHGYDISDYYQLLDVAGDWADLRELLKACEERGLKVILDLVLNHSSEEHPWFQAALNGDPHYRDFYIWREGDGDQPPTNWRSWCEPSCWRYREELGQYYLHSFTAHQPDLNWANPAVREALYEVLRFWVKQGVAGFRLDVINLIGKPERFESVADPQQRGYLVNQGPLLSYLKELREEVLEGDELLVIGETPLVTPELAAPMSRAQGGALDVVIHFALMDALPTWDLDRYRALQRRWAPEAGGLPLGAQYLNNHDQPRAISRFGGAEGHRVMSAKLFATLTHLTPGLPLVYQGEEIGMTSCPFPDPSELRDPFTISALEERLSSGEELERAFAAVLPMCRDHARTPMQWSAQPQAGFSTGTPWLKVNPNYTSVNVERDRARPDSIFRYYQALIKLRHTHPKLVTSAYVDHDYPSQALFVFERRWEGERWVTLANTGAEALRYVPALNSKLKSVGDEPHSAQLLLSNLDPSPSPSWRPSEPLELSAYEVRVYRLKSAA